MDAARASSRLWSIVLAGGEETRVGSLIRSWLGRPKPKQYCAFVGTRSLLQHTLDRAAKLSPWEHIVTVISREYAHDARCQLEGRGSFKILAQPASCKTAAAIYIPLTYIRTQDSQATVVIYPSDHFVYPESRFLNSVQRAIWTAEWLPDRVVLLGVSPEHLELDYGWITPGEKLDGSTNYQIMAVRSFLENPTAAQADAALAAGALWNTFVVVAKVDVLWELGWEHFLPMMFRLERLGQQIGTPQESAILDDIYRDLPAYGFSSDLLQHVPERIAVVEMTGVLWSDWGKPERIANTLRRIGRQPAFPLTCLSRPYVPIPLVGSDGGATANIQMNA